MIPLTGDEFLPDGLHFLPPGRGVVEDTVHRQQWHDGQDLFCTVELGGHEDGLQITEQNRFLIGFRWADFPAHWQPRSFTKLCLGQFHKRLGLEPTVNPLMGPPSTLTATVTLFPETGQFTYSTDMVTKIHHSIRHFMKLLNSATSNPRNQLQRCQRKEIIF